MAVQAAHSQQVYRVDGVSGNDGNAGFPTWSDALQTIQEAIDRASGGDEIWVKAGIYKPGTSIGSTFSLEPGVAVHGGFAGTETLRTQADPYVNLTYLSGDDVTGMGDDALHVVTSINPVIDPQVGAITRLDGFIIEDGNADAEDEDAEGGGLLVLGNASSSQIVLAVSRCRFANNQADFGGAVAVHRTGGVAFTKLTVQLINCQFMENAAIDGGAVWVSGGAAIVTNSLFVDNSATANGGAMHFRQICDDEPIDDCGEYSCINFQQTGGVVQNCTVVWNTAGSLGGGIWAERGIQAGLDIRASIFRDNSDGSSPTLEKEQIAQNIYCIRQNEVPDVIVTFSAIEADPLLVYAGFDNIDDDPLFVNGSLPGDYRLQAGSPAIEAGDVNASTFPEDTLDFDRDGDDAELAVDLAVNPWRIFGAEIDMGAYEFTFVNGSCQSDCVDSSFNPPPDGEVDGADLAILLADWGPCAPPCCSDSVGSDFLPPPDGEVDGADLAVLLDNWGPCSESLLGGGSGGSLLEDETLSSLLEELLETGDAALAETIAALLQEMMGE